MRINRIGRRRVVKDSRLAEDRYLINVQEVNRLIALNSGGFKCRGIEPYTTHTVVNIDAENGKTVTIFVDDSWNSYGVNEAAIAAHLVNLKDYNFLKTPGDHNLDGDKDSLHKVSHAICLGHPIDLGRETFRATGRQSLMQVRLERGRGRICFGTAGDFIEQLPPSD